MLFKFFNAQKFVRIEFKLDLKDQFVCAISVFSKGVYINFVHQVHYSFAKKNIKLGRRFSVTPSMLAFRNTKKPSALLMPCQRVKSHDLGSYIYALHLIIYDPYTHAPKGHILNYPAIPCDLRRGIQEDRRTQQHYSSTSTKTDVHLGRKLFF